MIKHRGLNHRLTAVLSVDVKGYRRLTGEEEAAAVRILTAYPEVTARFIQQYWAPESYRHPSLQ
jgi:hypothetical protein